MSGKTFLTISQQECSLLYKDILNNSESRWNSGLRLAEVKDYGGAISMAVISVEELIKAMIVFMDSKGFEFRSVKGKDNLFKHHNLRYVVAYSMFVFSVFGEDIIKFVINKKTGLKHGLEFERNAIKFGVLFD